MNYKTEVVVRLEGYDKCNLKKEDAKIIQRFLKSCMKTLEEKNEAEIMLEEKKYKMRKQAYKSGSSNGQSKPKVSVFHPIEFQVDKYKFLKFKKPAKDDPFEMMLRRILPDPECIVECSFPSYKPYIEKQLVDMFEKQEVHGKEGRFSKTSNPLQLMYVSRLNIFIHTKMRFHLQRQWESFCKTHKAYRKITPRIEFVEYLQI